MTIKITKRTRDVIERDKKVMLTTTREHYPFVAQKAEGDFAYDVEGNKFIDFATFISVYNFGDDAVKSVRSAVKSQVDILMHAAFTDYYSELPVAFAEKLVKMFPKGFGRVFFSNSGTEANEAAIKFSKVFTKRQYLMGFYNGFHGRTMGSLGLTASKNVQREHFGPYNSVIHAPYAYCYRCPFGQEYPSCGMACVDYIKKYPLAKEAPPDEVAAIFVEPVAGEGGYIVPPKEFIQGIREIATDNGILMVSDEVQAGYMRTGTFLAMDHFKVEADIYTMAKAVGAGLPMGVTVTRSSLGNIPAGSHANTFGGNLASVAGAKAQLEYVSKNYSSLHDTADRKGRRMMKRLRQMMQEYEIVGDVRGLGMMIGVEFVKDKKTKEPAIKEHEQILDICFNNGLILLPCGASSIRLIPPLTISDASLERGLNIFEDAVKKVNARYKD